MSIKSFECRAVDRPDCGFLTWVQREKAGWTNARRAEMSEGYRIGSRYRRLQRTSGAGQRQNSQSRPPFQSETEWRYHYALAGILRRRRYTPVPDRMQITVCASAHAFLLAFAARPATFPDPLLGRSPPERQLPQQDVRSRRRAECLFAPVDVTTSQGMSFMKPDSPAFLPSTRLPRNVAAIVTTSAPA